MKETMNIGKAFAIVKHQIWSKNFTDAEKMEAISIVLDATTINSITKDELRECMKWMYSHMHIINVEQHGKECMCINNVGTLNL